MQLRLRYINGQFVPLDEIVGLEEGEEITVEWQAPHKRLSPEEIRAAMKPSQGRWADFDEIETLIEDARSKWDKEWQNRQTL